MQAAAGVVVAASCSIRIQKTPVFICVVSMTTMKTAAVGARQMFSLSVVKHDDSQRDAPIRRYTLRSNSTTTAEY